ncbi:MAG: COG1361 S-layer family protein [Christensenellaceae bacterium]|jgi:hypothetical protein
MSKRILVLLLAVLLVAGLPLTTAGAETGMQPMASPPDSSPSISPSYTDGVLSIESTRTYLGMASSYNNGYQPPVGDGRTIIILPLKANPGEVDGNTMTFSIDLGSPADSPFDFRNYGNKTVQGDVVNFPGEAIFLADYTLPLAGGRINGSYPVTITASYTSGGVDMTQSFTVYVKITDGIDPNATPTPEPTPPSGGDGTTSQPKVIVSNYTISPELVYAGELFTVNVHLKNTSQKTAVKNIAVTYTSETTDMLPGEGTNTAYIESIGKDSMQDFTFSMEARADAKAGPQKIDLSITYEDNKNNPYTATDVVTVQVCQRIRLEYDPPTFPAQVYMGDSMSASLNLYNMGKNTLYNVSVVLDVPGIIPESSAFLGNMESGIAKTADIYASVMMSSSGMGMDEFGEGELSPEDMPAEMEMTEPEAFAGGQPMAVAVSQAEPAPAGAVAIIGGSDGPTNVYTEGGDPLPGDEPEDGASVDMPEEVYPGPVEGNFVVTYEDEYGDAYELTVPVSTELMEMPVYEEMYPEDFEEEPSAGFPWWGWIVIAGAAVAVVVPLIVNSRRKKRRQELLEDIGDDDIY